MDVLVVGLATEEVAGGMFCAEEGGEVTWDLGLLSVMYGRYWTYFVMSAASRAASRKEERAPEMEGGGLTGFRPSASGFVGTYLPV